MIRRLKESQGGEYDDFYVVYPYADDDDTYTIYTDPNDIYELRSKMVID